MNNKKLGFAGILAFALIQAPLAVAQINNPPAPVAADTPPAGRAIVDPDASAEPTIELTPSLTLGGRFDLKYELEKTFNLENIDDEDEATVEPELTLSLSFTPLEDFEAFINTEFKREYGFDISPASENAPLSLQVTEVFLQFDDLFEIGQSDVGLRLGRQRFDDEREWLYDERLDGPRVYYEWSDLTVELSATRQTVFDRDFLNADHQDKINNYFLYSLYELDNVEVGNFEIDELGVAGYIFKRDDLTEDNEDPLFIGIQSYGEVIDDLLHWLDWSHVRGRDGSDSIDGYAVDVGGSYEFSAPWKPSLVLGYAFGSGDSDPDDAEDNRFRQTGLQDNQYELDGLVSFRYYGVLLEPELSNLEILTAGAGIKPSDYVSMHLIYHRYRQDELSDELRDTNLDPDPIGESRDIGSAIDLVSGVVSGRWALDVEFGYFMPGEAFDEDENDNAFFTELDLKFKF